MSEIIFEEATLDELLDWVGRFEETAAEEMRERVNDLLTSIKALEAVAEAALVIFTAPLVSHKQIVNLGVALQAAGYNGEGE